jgi:hypothetical protein
MFCDRFLADNARYPMASREEKLPEGKAKYFPLQKT